MLKPGSKKAIEGSQQQQQKAKRFLFLRFFPKTIDDSYTSERILIYLSFCLKRDRIIGEIKFQIIKLIIQVIGKH